MKNEIRLIHGANATRKSFARIEDHLRSDWRFKDWTIQMVEYDCQDLMDDLVDRVVSSVRSRKRTYLIGHSMGGILAVAASRRAEISGVVTLASPLGGSRGADMLKWVFPRNNLFKNISTGNPVIRDIKEREASAPTLCFVTTSGGIPMMPEANDGVVTVSSQKCLRGSHQVEVSCNHFEVLMSDLVIAETKQFVLEAA